MQMNCWVSQDVKANSKKGYDLERVNYKRMNILRKTEHIELIM